MKSLMIEAIIWYENTFNKLLLQMVLEMRKVTDDKYRNIS